MGVAKTVSVVLQDWSWSSYLRRPGLTKPSHPGLLFLEVAEYVSMSRDHFQDEIRLSLTFVASWSHKIGPEAIA
jgi:hypothetical protein